MYKDFHKIFIGIILVFIDINILIDVLPDFIGYLFIISGLSNLYNETGHKEFLKSKNLNILMLLISVIGIFIRMDSMSEVTASGIVIATVSQVIQILSVYYMYSGIVNMLEDGEFSNDITASRRNYVYVMMITTFAMTFITNMDRGMMQVVIVVIVILNTCMVIAWMLNIRKVRNYYQMEN